MNNKLYIIACTALLSVTISACNKFVEIDPPITDLTAEVVFTDRKTINASVAGMYSNAFSGNRTNTAVWDYSTAFYGGMFADEIYYRTASFDTYVKNSYNARSAESASFWKGAYAVIYQTNSVIAGLETTILLPEEVRAQYLGEAKFLRAYFYLILVGFYGDVPLVLKTNVAENAILPRSPKATVMQQIITDLMQAESALANSTNPKTRATKTGASALLARAYLYNKNWALAETKATEVINSGAKLETISRVFLRSSTETLFSIGTNNSNPSRLNFTNTAILYVPAATTVNYRITDQLLAAFESGDQRRTQWIGTITSGTDVFRYSFKYKQRTTPTDASLNEDQVMIRLAEMYLIRAEARANLNKNAEGADDVNAIRNRAGLGNIAKDLSSPALLLAIEKERQVELFTEGHRWFDITRTGRADVVFGAAKPTTWKSYMALLPVSISELETNPNLTQNPGYQ